MNTNISRVYQVGGALAADSLYIERAADQRLAELCRAGGIVHILSGRQVGKTSLVYRCLECMQGARWTTVYIDLQIGRDAQSAEAWFYGMAYEIANAIESAEAGSLDRLGDWWESPAISKLSAVDRFLVYITDIALPAADARLVLCFDEVDATRELEFGESLFFAARTLYNWRADTKRNVQCLTILLVGSMNPFELVKDQSQSPFNVGETLELTDFSKEELAPFGAAWRCDAATRSTLLRRVFFWTHGQPFLTHKLSARVHQDYDGNTSFKQVDSAARALFLSDEGALIRDSNLQAVEARLRQRWLPSEDQAHAMVLFRRMRWGRGLRFQNRDLCHARLLLSGAVRLERGRLWIRNEIYRRVFGFRWWWRESPTGLVTRWLQRNAILLAALLTISIPLLIVVNYWANRASESAALALARADTLRDKETELRRVEAEGRKRSDELLAEAQDALAKENLAVIDKDNALREAKEAIKAKNKAFDQLIVEKARVTKSAQEAKASEQRAKEATAIAEAARKQSDKLAQNETTLKIYAEQKAEELRRERETAENDLDATFDAMTALGTRLLPDVFPNAKNEPATLAGIRAAAPSVLPRQGIGHIPSVVIAALMLGVFSDLDYPKNRTVEYLSPDGAHRLVRSNKQATWEDVCTPGRSRNLGKIDSMNFARYTGGSFAIGRRNQELEIFDAEGTAQPLTVDSGGVDPSVGVSFWGRFIGLAGRHVVLLDTTIKPPKELKRWRLRDGATGTAIHFRPAEKANTDAEATFLVADSLGKTSVYKCTTEKDFDCRTLCHLPERTEEIRAVNFSHGTGQYIVVGDASGRVTLYDIDAKGCPEAAIFPHSEPITSAIFYDDGNFMTSTTAKELWVWTWSRDSQSKPKQYGKIPVQKLGLSEFRFSTNGDTMIMRSVRPLKGGELHLPGNVRGLYALACMRLLDDPRAKEYCESIWRESCPNRSR